MRTIGFIGLGMMGTPMAHLLHEAGHRLVVQDVNPATEAAFAAAHADVVRAPDAAAFAACDVVFTMLPNSDIVDAVVDGLASHLPAGACVIDMSSADPHRTRALAARLAARGLGLLDAPVSGGVKKAVAGTLAIMAGGDPALFERQRPLLAVLGQAITYVGPVGAGHALKALNNYVSAAAMIATAEAIHAGAAFGIDAATVVDVINASTGRNNTTENKAHQFMLNGAFNSGFSLALQAKDVGIAAALGPVLGQPMRLAQQVSAYTRDASAELGPAADHTELYRYVV
ncbi:2-hydroxy-3-oxopropionate reductase [Bordetella genomosp. 1]|uniref:2-hydroxy-3-oxopropionate reductase n=1 Tax=Bordetella genomosp. 1 TaxID=1395607 RepID=A0A261SDF2_9BORD|nr:2-hydroxy-3-oxopropionate reductase [Bordetella genomosp. 1]OZI63980.1 2-hydroxy-3-oxopropionate reductase [Bordetella genomosp. 1]